MEYILDGIKGAMRIILSGDPLFRGAVLTSLAMASLSTLLATLLGVPLGLAVAHCRFRGREALFTTLNTLMSLPTVMVGLLIYSLLSRQGLFGSWGLLFTRSAIVIGQTILAFPIICGLTASAVKDLDQRVMDTARSLGANSRQRLWIFLGEARFGVLAAIAAGFGRVFAEVGVSMMLGGNIRGYTRTITTAIALETNKGEFALGIALGIVLLLVSLGVNVLFSLLRKKSE